MSRTMETILIVVGVVVFGLSVFEFGRWTKAQPEIFGPVLVRAYTPWDNEGSRWGDHRTATNKPILRSDYSVAISPDIERWIGGISNCKMVHIPGYNKEGEFSMMNDRSDQQQACIEVLMTVPDREGAIRRARRWGVKKGVLKRIRTPVGYVYWVEIETK